MQRAAGRQAIGGSSTSFVHVGAFGADGVPFCCNDTDDSSVYVLGGQFVETSGRL